MSKKTWVLKQLLRKTVSDLPEPDFTENVLAILHKETCQECEIDQALGKLIRHSELHIPPKDFTKLVISMVDKKEGRPVYRPLLSKGSGIRIILTTLTLTLISIIFPMDSNGLDEVLPYIGTVDSIVEYLRRIPMAFSLGLIAFGLLLMSDSLQYYRGR